MVRRSTSTPGDQARKRGCRRMMATATTPAVPISLPPSTTLPGKALLVTLQLTKTLPSHVLLAAVEGRPPHPWPPKRLNYAPPDWLLPLTGPKALCIPPLDVVSAATTYNPKRARQGSAQTRRRFLCVPLPRHTFSLCTSQGTGMCIWVQLALIPHPKTGCPPPLPQERGAGNWPGH